MSLPYTLVFCRFDRISITQEAVLDAAFVSGGRPADPAVLAWLRVHAEADCKRRRLALNNQIEVFKVVL